MARTTRSAPFLVLAIAAVGFLALSNMLAPSFTQPPAESRRAALLGGLAAATLAAAPAHAAKFSVFGFGAEGAKSVSDPYSKNDVDGYSPYSEFSNIEDKDANLYKPFSESYMNKRRKMIKISEDRLKQVVPGALAAANKEEVKMETTRQVYMLRDSMSYLADAAKIQGDNSPTEIKNKFFDQIGDMKVLATVGRFSEASQKYEDMMGTLSEFRSSVGM